MVDLPYYEFEKVTIKQRQADTRRVDKIVRKMVINLNEVSAYRPDTWHEKGDPIEGGTVLMLHGSDREYILQETYEEFRKIQSEWLWEKKAANGR